MSFDWAEYLKLANSLIFEPKEQSEEARLRSSISRAYYSVFCRSRVRAGFVINLGSDVHKSVIEKYKNSSVPREKLAGKRLDELRRLRNEADYDANKIIANQNAQRALGMAKDICRFLGIK